MKIETKKIMDAETRRLALEVIKEVYFDDKKWIHSVESEIPEDIADSTQYSWFLATVNGKPSGVLRLQYDPTLEFPSEYKVTLNRDIDIKKVLETCRFVDIGRFMILPRYRKNVFVALRLMGIALGEVVQRDYTHFITDVFEGEVNSPLKFHTNVLGFEVIGNHMHGELNCSLTRIILTLDILKAYGKLKERRNRIYRVLTTSVKELLDRKLAMSKTAGHF